MSRSCRCIASAAVGIFALFLAPAAWALRCGNDLVAPGDRKIEVLKSCGEPLFVEHWEEDGVTFTERGRWVAGTRDTRTVEEWTYNFGPARFIHFLRFVDGKLDAIAVGPRGFSGAVVKRGSPECGHIVVTGDRRLDVLRKCGEPAAVDERTKERIVGWRADKRSSAHGRRLTINVEEWTYNFGPTRFLVFITLENGVVVDIDTGDYGF